MRSIGGRGRQDYAKDPAGSEYRRRTQQAGFLGDGAEGSSSTGGLDHVAVCGLMAIPPLMREPERAALFSSTSGFGGTLNTTEDFSDLNGRTLNGNVP